jgi:putative ABC transport system substrate-binding protein
MANDCGPEQAGAPRRRDVLVWLAGALGSSGTAWAQPQAGPTIGYLGSETPERAASRLEAFRRGLAETGFVEGRNLKIEFRWANGQYSQLPALATELVERSVAVLVAPGGAPVVLAAKAATTRIPIVFEMGGDPIALGVVGSLSRPGGNITGVSSLSVEVSRKRLEFMHELFPSAGRLAVAVNPTSPTARSQIGNLQAAADSLSLGLEVLEASTEAEFDALFAAPSRLGTPGLTFTSDPYFAYRSRQLAEFAARHAVPAITQSRDFPNAGGLMSYGGDFNQSHHLAGVYTGRVLQGATPSDLPVQLVTRVELFINLKTAASLGFVFPPSLLSSADVIIE